MRCPLSRSSVTTFGWSDAEVGRCGFNRPFLLRNSEDRLRRMSEFFIIQFLKDNGLLEHGPSYYSAVQLSENRFMDKFIRPFRMLHQALPKTMLLLAEHKCARPCDFWVQHRLGECLTEFPNTEQLCSLLQTLVCCYMLIQLWLSPN
ncbi:hypothetical protein BS78_K251700 [Paspalum vaginatum]|uniref:Uncharacterized protein n=1 Tax=Paspalum vaginatum TaxID=158149 RepID=A0A9W8CCE4_9POAL|nr:hypothetical protein BS78_K251700 [Paspalum vaginatum]